MRSRSVLLFLCASFALAGAGAWQPPALDTAERAQPAAHLAPVDVDSVELRSRAGADAGTGPWIPAAAALLWTAPDRSLPRPVVVGHARVLVPHARASLPGRGPRAPPRRTDA